MVSYGCTIRSAFVLITSLALSGFTLSGPQPSVTCPLDAAHEKEILYWKLCRRYRHPTHANIWMKSSHTTRVPYIIAPPAIYWFNMIGAAYGRMLTGSTSSQRWRGAVMQKKKKKIGSSFRAVENPHESKGSGCGCGVSWELKL